MLDLDELTRYFERIRRSAFRLELLDRYTIESEHADDFWLLDDRDVMRMYYDEDGRFRGGEIPPPSELARYQRARDAAVAASEPFAVWWARHPEEWRANRAT